MVATFARIGMTYTTLLHLDLSFQSSGCTSYPRKQFACSLSTRFIQQALPRLLVDHHLKMASKLKSLKQHVIRAFNMDLVCPLVPKYFTRHTPRHHIVDSSLCFWYLFQHWAYLGFFPSWHVINSTFITVLPRDAFLILFFKGFLSLPREMQTSLVLLREETPLAFLREQTHLFSLHHLRMVTQNNWISKFIWYFFNLLCLWWFNHWSYL